MTYVTVDIGTNLILLVFKIQEDGVKIEFTPFS